MRWCGALCALLISGCYAQSLEAVLDEIEGRGGADAFLSEAGTSADELAALRERAVAVE